MKIKCPYCDTEPCLCNPLDKLIAGRKKNWNEKQIKKCYENNLKEIEKLTKRK